MIFWSASRLSIVTISTECKAGRNIITDGKHRPQWSVFKPDQRLESIKAVN